MFQFFMNMIILLLLSSVSSSGRYPLRIADFREPRLSEQASSTDPDDFNSKFGTHYVSRIDYGGRLDVLFTLTAEDSDDSTFFELGLEANMEKGELEAKMKGFFKVDGSETVNRTKSYIEVKSSGVPFFVSANPSYDEVQDYIGQSGNWTKEYKTNNDGVAEPLYFHLSDTEDFKSDHADDYDKYQYHLKEASEKYFEYMLRKKRLIATAKDLRLICESDPKLLEEIYDAYIVEQEKLLNDTNNYLDEIIAYRRKSFTEIVAKSFDFPKPDRCRYLGLNGESVATNVKVGVREGLYFLGFSKNPCDHEDHVEPWLRGQLSFERGPDRNCIETKKCFFGNLVELQSKLTKDFNDWVRVRHVPGNNVWYSYYDNLEGNIARGTPYDDHVEWTVKFEEAVPGYNQFLFATGDKKKWLVVSKDTAFGDFKPEMRDRNILASSEKPYHDYYVGWSNGDTEKDFGPFISLHTPFNIAENKYESGLGICLYAGNRFPDEAGLLQTHNGADVYIRKYDYNASQLINAFYSVE